MSIRRASKIVSTKSSTNYFNYRYVPAPSTLIAYTAAGTVAAMGPVSNFTFSYGTHMPALQLAAFTNLYSYYRLRKVVFRITPQYRRPTVGALTNFGTYNGSLLQSTPLLYRTAQTTAEFQETDNTTEDRVMYNDPQTKRLPCYSPSTVTLIPAVESQIYESALQGAYKSSFGDWLSTAQDQSVTYYAATFRADLRSIEGLSAPDDGLAQRWTIQPILYWQFKDLKGFDDDVQGLAEDEKVEA